MPLLLLRCRTARDVSYITICYICVVPNMFVLAAADPTALLVTLCNVRAVRSGVEGASSGSPHVQRGVRREGRRGGGGGCCQRCGGERKLFPISFWGVRGDTDALQTPRLKLLRPRTLAPSTWLNCLVALSWISRRPHSTALCSFIVLEWGRLVSTTILAYLVSQCENIVGEKNTHEMVFCSRRGAGSVSPTEAVSSKYHPTRRR